MILQQLQSYQPVDATEDDHRQKTLEFLQDGKGDHFVRTRTDGHCAGSALLLNADRTQTLLMHHAFLDKWLQFGGHCDGDPEPLNTAVRETQEESGIDDIRIVTPEIFDIDVHWIPENPKKGEGPHWHYDIRYLLWTPQTDFTIDCSSKELRWFDIAELLKMDVDPALHRMLVKVDWF